MPFDPLPRILTTDLTRLAGHEPSCRAVDLGCGDGRLGRRLGESGVRIWGLDRHAQLGACPDIVGDVRSLPLAPGSLDLILAANLVRHLLVRDPAGDFLDSWFGALRRGGLLYILEDEPDDETPATRNYHALQDMLVRIGGSGRGPLLARGHFLSIAARLPKSARMRGGASNNVRRPDPVPVLNMLAGAGGKPAGSVRRLMRAITRDGLAYGKYWWLRICHEGD